MKDRKKHYRLTQLARIKAMGDWGYKNDSEDKAIAGMSVDNTMEGALLEIVRRLNQAIRAWSKDNSDENDYSDENDSMIRPKNAIPFSSSKVGDLLYTVDLEEGITRWIIIAKDEEGCVRVVHEDPWEIKGRVYLSWGTKNCTVTLEEATRQAAESDLAYHSPRIRQAQEILAALEKGEAFEHLLGPVD